MTNRKRILSSALIVAMSLGGILFSGSGMAHSDADDFHELNAQWVDAFARRDYDAIRSLMHSESLLLAPNQTAVKGPDAIVDVWQSWGQLPNVLVEFGADQIEVSATDDLAYDYGWYLFEFDTEEGRFTDYGKYIVVWRKEDGRWKVAADIFNSSLPLQ